jgi:Outer membrane protein beta-barrel domain
MKTFRSMCMILAAASIPCLAQQWEVGGGAGVSFPPGVSVTSPLGAATTGFKPGVAFGAFFGQNLYRHLSGEVHYAFMQSNLKLETGGNSATFSGQSHAIHYDLLIHTHKEDRPTQLFGIVGGGMKVYRGTGKEAAYQPLSQFGYFTKTQSVEAMAVFGAGVKHRLSPHLFLRAEIRDYFTAFPEKVIAPAPGAKFGNMVHDFVPMVSFSYQY